MTSNPNYTCINILSPGHYVFTYRLTDLEPNAPTHPTVFLAGPFSSPMMTQAKMGALKELARNHVLRVSSGRGDATPEGTFEFDSSRHKLGQGLYFACTLGDDPTLVDIVAVNQDPNEEISTIIMTDISAVSTTSIPTGV